MLQVTFLGWQGWLVSTETANVLVDPLLGESIGRGPAATRQTFVFWPPRRFKAAACPRVDALVISHEHEDHFNIASLARIDRRVRVILSGRASIAAWTLLTEMGFEVELLQPGRSLRIKDLELTFFAADHLSSDVSDEWDTLGYLFRHVEAHGSFFSNVDVPITLAMSRALAEAGTLTLTFIRMALQLHRKDANSPAQSASEMHRPPADAEFALEDAVPKLRAGGRIRPLPGLTIIIAPDGIHDPRPGSDFIEVDPPEKWPPQPHYWRDPRAPLRPVTAVEDFSAAALDELEAGLARLAAHMYGGQIFKQLYSLDDSALGGRKASFLWILNTSDVSHAVVYEYRPDACAFIPVALTPELMKTYAGVVVSFASDLLGLFRGQFEPRCIVNGYHEDWLPSCRASFLRTTLWPFFHPLRHPMACLARYRTVLGEERDAPILFRAPPA